MKPINVSVIAAPSGLVSLVKTALLAGALLALGSGLALAADFPKTGSTNYTIHYVFDPLGTVEIPGVGKVTALEMVGPTENTEGKPWFNNMKAKCYATNVETSGKKWIDGGCTLTDSDGDMIFSYFDTRDIDKAQPKMDCGTHHITGGTGKYKGLTGTEAFACNKVATPAGAPPGSFAMDLPHHTVWEIK